MIEILFYLIPVGVLILGIIAYTVIKPEFVSAIKRGIEQESVASLIKEQEFLMAQKREIREKAKMVQRKREELEAKIRANKHV